MFQHKKKKTHPQLHMCKLLIQTIQFSFGSVYSSSSGCQKLQAIVKIYHVQRHGTRTHFHFRWRNASHYKVHCRCHVSSVEILEKEIKKKSRKNLPQQKLHAVLQIRLVLYWSNITDDSIKAEVFRGRISMYSWREEVQIYVKGNETTPVVSVTEVLYNYGHAT